MTRDNASCAAFKNKIASSVFNELRVANKQFLRSVSARGLLLFGLLALLFSSSFCAHAEVPAADKHSIHESKREGMRHRVVVVGGGLAGLSAAISAHKQVETSGLSIEILVVEKMPKLGGNSMKASSGLNALTPESGDSVEMYKRDTLASGGGLSKEELVSTLVAESAEALKMIEALGVNLDKITRLGGHSVPRTHSNPVGGNVGFSIMQAMIKHVGELPGVKIMTNTKLEEIRMEGGRVSSVRLMPTEGEKGAEVELDCDAIIMASGGFGANKTLLQELSPQAAGLATTNGPWATGDSIHLARHTGAKLIHLDHVQIHPTGLVDPKDKESGTKFLAPEKLRGVGGILLNAQGHRFVDELATRDVVSAAMLNQPEQTAHLVLSDAAVEEYGRSAIDFYCSKGFFVKGENVADLAQKLSISAASLQSELEQYNALAQAGKLASDKFGKTVYPATFPTDKPLFAASVVPVVHYTMGGLEINAKAEVLSESDPQPVHGLYAAGEASGGLHGVNRLGGNSLIECAVFGRIAGREAVDFVTASAIALGY